MKNLLNKVSANPNKKKLFCLFLALAVIVMVVIFCFSAQNAAKSDEVEISVRKTGREIMENVLGNLETRTTAKIINLINGYVRKIAHVILFSALGFALFGAAICFDPIKKIWQKALLVLLVGGLYGAGDEIHQIFVPGRTSEVLDVCIDLVGVAIGILIMLAGYKIAMSFIAKKHQKAKKLKV